MAGRFHGNNERIDVESLALTLCIVMEHGVLGVTGLIHGRDTSHASR